MSRNTTPVFLLIEQSKVLPKDCLCRKKVPLTDVELTQLLINIIQEIDRDRLQITGSLQQIEQHLLIKYGEIYESQIGK